MRTMTIPSPTMRRLKQAAAAARAAADAARAAAPAPAPVLRRPAGDDVDGSAARGPARVHRPISPSSGRRHATAGARVRSNGRAPAPLPASGRAVRGPPPAAPPSAPAAAAGGGGNAALAVAVGDRVLVRTPVTNTLAGQHVVMTIGAVVVTVSAAAEGGDGGGYLEVILDGDFPPQDPWSSVRITRDQIVVTTPAVATNPPAAAAGAAASATVLAPARLGKRESGGSATSLRGAEEQRSLRNAGFKRSRY
ncbi:unnamed protein product [Urochloa humidicola]